VGSVLAGYLGLPKLGAFDWNLFGHYLEPVVVRVGDVGHAAQHGHHASLGVELILMALSVAVAGFGIYFAWTLYGAPRGEAQALAGGERWAQRFPTVHKLLFNKYYVDEIYDASVVKGTWATARGLFRFDAGFIDGVLVNGSRHFTVGVSLLSGFFDKYAVDGLVNLIGWLMKAGSRFFRSVQTGVVSQSATALVLGVLALSVFYFFVRMS